MSCGSYLGDCSCGEPVNLCYRTRLDFLGYLPYDVNGSPWVPDEQAEACQTHYHVHTFTAVITWTDDEGGPVKTHTWVSTHTKDSHTGAVTTTDTHTGDACPDPCMENWPAARGNTVHNATVVENWDEWYYDDLTVRKRITYRHELSSPYTKADWMAEFDTLYHYMSVGDIIEFCSVEECNLVTVGYDASGDIVTTPDVIDWTSNAEMVQYFMSAYISDGGYAGELLGQRAIHTWASVPDWVEAGSGNGYSTNFTPRQPCGVAGNPVSGAVYSAAPGNIHVDLAVSSPGNLYIADLAGP